MADRGVYAKCTGWKQLTLSHGDASKLLLILAHEVNVTGSVWQENMQGRGDPKGIAGVGRHQTKHWRTCMSLQRHDAAANTGIASLAKDVHRHAWHLSHYMGDDGCPALAAVTSKCDSACWMQACRKSLRTQVTSCLLLCASAAYLPRPAPTSTSLLDWSKPQLFERLCSTFCIPVLVKEPYKPSIPSPPPSLFCNTSRWSATTLHRATVCLSNTIAF